MSTETKVGAFMVASLVVLGATVYSVNSTQNVRGQVGYTTHIRYAGGIAPGTPVLFGGIRVGQVTAVGPWSEDPTRIEIAFAVRSGTPVNEESMARVGSVSLMSSPTLLLTTGSNAARRLVAGEVVRSKETVSQDELMDNIAAVTESANAAMSEARAVLANLNQISGRQNQKRIESILAELNTLLARESPKIAEITNRIVVLAGHADEVMMAARPLVSNADHTVTNVNATVDAIREPLARDLVELERTMQEARSLLENVRNVVQVNESEIEEAVRNLRVTSDNFRALSETLKQRPWNLIRTTQPEDRKVPQ
jgi:phospholipid/cholesterol/gamma-HCH transport system substrate-binding protein